MEGEEKSQADGTSSPSDTDTATRDPSLLPPTATAVSCTSSPKSVDGPAPSVESSKPTAISTDDPKSECDKNESNSEKLNKCPKTSETDASLTDVVVVSEGAGNKKDQESLAESLSECSDNPKTDSETDMIPQTVNPPMNEAQDNAPCPDSDKNSPEKGETSSQTHAAQLIKENSKEDKEPRDTSDGPTPETQPSNCSDKMSESISDKNEINDEVAKSALQGADLESHDEADVESHEEGQSQTADMSVIQSEKTNSSKSQSGETSEIVTVDESSNLSSETVPSMAHADLDQVNVEESMDTTPPCEDSDPFSCSKDIDKHEDASMEVDPEPNSVSAPALPQKDVLEESSISDTATKSSSDKPTTEVEANNAGTIEVNTENLTENEDQRSTGECDDLMDVDKNNTKTSEAHTENFTGIEEQKSAERCDDAMDVDDSSLRSKGTDPTVSDEVNNDPSVLREDIEDTEDNSNDVQTHSGKDNASPEPDQTIIGDKMGEEECISDTISKGVSVNAETSQTSEETSSEELISSLASQQEMPESQSDSSTAAQKDSSTEKSSHDQGDSKLDVPENTETGAANKHKVGIHLVSTSSLVSRKDDVDKDTENDVLESAKASDANDPSEDSPDENCAECGKMSKCKYKIRKEMGHVYLCEDDCYTKYRKANDSPRPKVLRARKLDQGYEHKCGHCSKNVDMKLEKTLTWETMDFCNEECLEKCQRTHGSNCANCKAYVQAASLGKYCVRFGYDMKQFCSAPCLEDFKKGLKVCSYCQKDISRGEGFLAPVGDKGAFKDFCVQDCMEKYEQMSNNTVPPEVTQECAVCNEVKAVKVQVLLDSKWHKLCSDPCFAAFKFVNDIVADKCDMCKKYYDRDRSENFSVFYDEAPHSFCCKTCMNVYILAKRKIVPCSWCKVKKYNFDMIKRVSGGQNVLMMCSLHCLELYQASPNTAAATSKQALPRKITVKRGGLVAATNIDKDKNTSRSMPVISSVTSLAPSVGQLQPASSDPPAPPTPVAPILSSVAKKSAPSSDTVKTVFKQQFILRPPPHPEMSNCAVQVKPMSVTKSVSCQPEVCEVATQTDDSSHQPVLIPVPVPIYIPMPMHMYTIPYPVPVPIPLPIPVPFFIPTTKNSAKGILQEIKRIQENVPSDPFEAELLMMAEMVAGEKKGENTETESEDGANDADDTNANDAGNASEPDYSPEHQDAIGDDVLQMALKMASDFDEPAPGFVGTVAPTSVSQSKPSQAVDTKDESEGEDIEVERITRSGKKAVKRSSSRSSSVSSKRMRLPSASDQQVQPVHDSKAFIKGESVEKPDANMCLKFSLGVNAWKNWVIQKNAELEKSPSKKAKVFKTELLQLTSDELNYSLCLFVCEAQDPNSRPYPPDTLYYLCLGIQQYLMENGRVDNIFCDPYYEKFTDCLDDAVKRFSPIQPNSEQIVTRIQEEHLWESKQLGAYSPFVLLNTLMYFNTKHFNLMTVEEHMQLSFSHIMKHWKRNATSPNTKAVGVKSNNVLLRFYPPPSALAANSKKKKVYEQQEDETNPLRCPVKLYEFYLSKCPESVKTRNDVFYLVPERSCVPDSPVWYSTMSLGNEYLQKMLNRIMVVREIVDI
ncbi:zinc finger MYM-type protein 3 [Thrips palmi]|uniref:Zinc finger MYM-type protein 3 n=1 Tax=Thrips palmi TaxID=161013 RepID=A0A6P9ABI7_THRPL|nr:zinc finger MYM-type protein 3 [Thrips palmi]